MRLIRLNRLSAIQALLGALVIIFICLAVIQPGSCDSKAEHLILDIPASGSFDGYPPNPTEFHLSEPTTITKIQTYHYNSGQGKNPDWIGIESNGNLEGRWNANGDSGNTYWVVLPEIYLQPGTYKVVDSDPRTWSQNSNTGGRGITSVWGR